MLGQWQSGMADVIKVLSLTVLVPTLVHAQSGILSGKIVDKCGGEALVGASIIVSSDIPSLKPRGTAADKNGLYEITDISPGEYSVTVSCLGFETLRVANFAIPGLAITTMNVSLVPTAINLHALTVTASRRREKILEAPASVNVVESENIDRRTALTLTEHLKAVPAVDVAATGLNQSNAVVRGFNNIFSSALLILVDNRIARVPSLRFNAYNFIPTIDQDIERIEVVSGPGSALYGPNAAAGVMHIITKSPFASKGTTISFGAGEREVFIGSFRHAGSVENRVGYKISGQYYQGKDWESFDPAEPDSVQLFRPGPSGPELVGGPILNRRDFSIEKTSGEARVDFFINGHTLLILNGGYNRESSMELTPLGAGQAIDWTYTFAQARFMYRDLFMHGFVNASDAGDTYLRRTGQLIIDKSRLWAGQLQHRFAANDRFSFIYGLDALLTRPNTESTISGCNEDTDDSDEFGVYLQSEGKLSEHVTLVGAARIDDNSKLERPLISPRAALAYQPNRNHNVRLTYNRAFSTPDNANLHLDILQSIDPFGVGIDIRAEGVPETGFHWRINENGAMFRSPFAPLDPRGLETGDFINLNDPDFINVQWGVARGVVNADFAGELADRGVGQDTIGALTASMLVVTPDSLAGVNNTLRTFNPDTRFFQPSTVGDIADIDRLKPTITQTFEFGYKGIVGNRLKFSIDLYRTKKHDFIGPLTVETPNVFLDQDALSAYLEQEFTTAYANADEQDRETLDMLDDAALGGNGNGTPVDELASRYSNGATGIPFGTVSPEEALDPEAVLFTFRNFAEIVLYGADLAFAYHLNRYWTFGGSYSRVSKSLFEKSIDQVHDIFLNAPKHKFGIYARYANQKAGFNAHTRLRFVDAFEMSSPFMDATVESYVVVDLNLGWDLPHGPQLALTIQNLFDNKHIEFAGAPPIGRLAILRVSQSF